MNVSQELILIKKLLENKTSYKYDEEGSEEIFFRNEDLENLLVEQKFSYKTQKHCRKFLDARNEFGFLYRGIPMSVIDQAKCWDVFSEDLLLMDFQRLNYYIVLCKKIKIIVAISRTQHIAA